MKLVWRQDDWLLPPEVSSNDRCVDLDELTTEGHAIYYIHNTNYIIHCNVNDIKNL